jgi:hypothetical protein|tara:strand:- start:2511 stop:2690 length:180 start_codon:yes stop_codon:yes gene_type:complete
MKAFAKFILSRLKERSTWLGIISLLTAAGISLSPDEAQAIAAAGVATAGAVAILTRDAF